MSHRSPRRRLAGALLAGILLAAGPAAAHADLVHAEPSPNSRVDAAPDALRLRFSEPVEDTYTNVEVEGPDGVDRALETRIEGDDRREVRVPLEPLPDGVHTVRWRTLSAADGHTKSGVHLLAVNASLAGPGSGGNGSAPDPANATVPAEAGSGPGTGEALVRGLAFAGAALAVGVPLVLLALPARTLAGFPRRRLLAAGAGGGVLAAAATVTLVGFLAGRIEASLSTAFATTNGARMAWRTGLHLLGAGLLAGGLLDLDARRRGALLGAGALAGAGGLLAASLAGHAAALETRRSLAVGMDLVHQLAVAFWISGVAALLVAAVDGRSSPDRLAGGVRRLSPLFVAAVAAIVVTGSYGAWIHLPRVSDLWTTGYGQALSAKILLLLPLVAVGAYHRYVLLPGLEGVDGARALSRLRRSVGAEVLVMVLVLGAAGALTNLSPPAGTATGPAPGAGGNATPNGTASDELQGVLHAFEGDGYRLEFAVRPQPVTVGAQNVTVRASPLEGSLPHNADVVLQLNPPSDPYGEGETPDLTRWRNDTWSAEGPIFVEEGEWRVLLALQGKDTYVQDEFRVDVG